MVDDRRIELLTSSVSRKRSTSELIVQPQQQKILPWIAYYVKRLKVNFLAYFLGACFIRASRMFAQDLFGGLEFGLFCR